MKTKNPMIRNREAAELCCLAVRTLDHYRKEEDRGLIEGIHWISIGGRSVRWWQIPLEHWRDHRGSREDMEFHRRWVVEKWVNSIKY